jgi:hypothetical protein
LKDKENNIPIKNNISFNKNYTDYKNGFSFYYPKDFVLDVNDNYPESGNVFVTLRRPSYGDWSFGVSGDYNHQSFEDAIKSYPFKNEKDFQQKTIIVSGKDSRELSYNTSNIINKTVYIRKDNGEYIAIDWKSSEDISKSKSIQNNLDDFYTFLSTFKLIE